MVSVAFILPARGGSGGANSVVQEALALSGMGADILVAVADRYQSEFIENYRPAIEQGLKLAFYREEEDLAEQISAHRVVVATVNPSVSTLKRVMERNLKSKHIPAYYVQDYEPLFYPAYSDQWNVAAASYALIPHCLLFAKTEWIRRMVYKNHGVRVAAVRASVDHARFFPAPASSGQISITAMIRPSTPRRAPRRTVEVINALARQAEHEVVVNTFGCSTDELSSSGLKLDEAVSHHGKLRPGEVADLLRKSHLFIDASDYQAFGRTAIEGMACGCVPIVPDVGGADEFAVHGRNAFQVDTRSSKLIYDSAMKFLGMSDTQRGDMRIAALKTASAYSVVNAAASELELFWKATQS